MGPLGATLCIRTAGRAGDRLACGRAQPEDSIRRHSGVIAGSRGDTSCDGGHTLKARWPVYHSLQPAVPLN